jgi:hypothetical protein
MQTRQLTKDDNVAKRYLEVCRALPCVILYLTDKHRLSP